MRFSQCLDQEHLEPMTNIYGGRGRFHPEV